ncbi:NAD-dependent epimerase/dehydratase family protein [bacterium]|nr:NAD-dependent epimerase/dehydratase family protein [bacterium]MBU1881320.1 NAD-dependent epimerase/dehydratase family protein [bacterium]
MNKLLITGGTGYIGRNLAEFYLKQGISVRLLVRDPQKVAQTLKDRCELYQGDITEPATFGNAFNGVDAVIHSAGQLGRFRMPYKELYAINVAGTLNVLHAAMTANVSRFIHLSAGGVTGPLKQSFVDETYPPAPVTDYERTKWEAEKQVLEIARSKDYNLLVLRPTFTYGAGDPHKLKLFKAIKRGQFFFIGNGKSTVHPVYIDDLIRGIDAGLKSDVHHDSIIIGGSRAVTKRELASSIAAALKVKQPKLMVPVWFCRLAAVGFELLGTLTGLEPPLTRSRILALSENWGYSIEKARRLIGYIPTVELQEGIEKTTLWYHQQRWL